MRNTFLLLLLFFTCPLFAQVLTSVRPWLGVAIEKGVTGVKVKSAFPDTPASKAGITSDDEIISISGVKVKTPEELIQEVIKKGVGFTVKVEFLRKGKLELREMTLVIMPDVLDVVKKKLLTKMAPDFKAIDIRNPKKKISLKNFLGKPVVLEFWATWCPSCVGSTPRLVEFANQHKGKIEIVSLSNEAPEVIKKYLVKLDRMINKKNNLITYLQSLDQEIGKNYMASSIPMFVLINKKGEVVDLDLGGGSVLENILKKAEGLL